MGVDASGVDDDLLELLAEVQDPILHGARPLLPTDHQGVAMPAAVTDCFWASRISAIDVLGCVWDRI